MDLPPPPPPRLRSSPSGPPIVLIVLAGIVFTVVPAIFGFLTFRRILEVEGSTRGSATAICDRTYALLDAAAAIPDAAGPAPEELGHLLPEELGLSFDPLGDEPIPDPQTLAEGRNDERGWIDELEHDGFERGLQRYWGAPSGHVILTQVLVLGSHADALAFQEWIVGGSCPNSHDVFEAPGVRGTIGLQIWWTGGDKSEQISFVRGDRRYLVSVRGGSVPPRRLVLLATEAISATAR